MSETTIIKPEKNVNQRECDGFSAKLKSAVDSGAVQVIIDCREVQYMNSMAIAALVETQMKVMEKGGAVSLVGPGEFLLRSLELIGVLSLLDVCDSIEEAGV